jgi:hypothetical protein
VTIYRRTIGFQVQIDGQVIPDAISASCSFSMDDPVAKAEVTCRTYPSWAENNKSLVIAMGATPGVGPIIRFSGVMRAPTFTAQTGRKVTITGLGKLNKAAEYMNWEDIQGIGGLLPGDLLGTATTDKITWQGSGTAAQIISAVLNKCGLAGQYNAADIQDTGRVYPYVNWENFVWQAGTPTDPLDMQQIFQDAGQSGLDYIQKYNQIEAEYSETVVVDPVTQQPKVTNPQGGFYKIGESLGGQIFCIRVGGRPRNVINTSVVGSTTVPHVFVEGVNITDGRLTRGYPIANTVLVKGADYGFGDGPEFFLLHNSNPLMGDFRYNDPQPPNSPMIDHSTIAPDPLTALATDRHDKALRGLHGASDYNTVQPLGMDCETVAKARMLEVNRVPVTGSVTTIEDWTLGIAQTCLVAGAYDPATGNSQPGRMNTNEKLWITALTVECGDQNGAPVFKQTLTLMGGGWPDNVPQ